MRVRVNGYIMQRVAVIWNSYMIYLILNIIWDELEQRSKTKEQNRLIIAQLLDKY